MTMAGYRRAAIGASVLGLLLAGPAWWAARAADPTVTIDNFTFNPATITVPVGTKLVWVNRDDIPHLVVGRDEKAIKSPPLDTGDSYAFTFARPGTYAYFCGIHPMMQGTVVVH
jgi:plastocyanin